MNRELHIKNADIKYWIDEYPHIENLKSEIYYSKYSVNKIEPLQPQKLALEVYLHRDASNYGILGVEYSPNPESKIIDVGISYVKENSVSYISDLLKYSDYMYYGLPEECLENVKYRVENYIETRAFSSGHLLFSLAVNSEVGSSPNLFGIMAEMLLNFIVRNNNNLNNYEIDYDAIVQEIFLNSAFFNKS